MQNPQRKAARRAVVNTVAVDLANAASVSSEAVYSTDIDYDSSAGGMVAFKHPKNLSYGGAVGQAYYMNWSPGTLLERPWSCGDVTRTKLHTQCYQGDAGEFGSCQTC